MVSSSLRIRFLTALWGISCLLSVLWDQEYPLRGVKRPNPHTSLKRVEEYKRVHQLALRHLLSRKLDEAQAVLRDHSQARAMADSETHYLGAAIHAAQVADSHAVNQLVQAIALGLPTDRVVAGPRVLFSNIANTQLYQALLDNHAYRPIHGTMVGSVTANGVSF